MANQDEYVVELVGVPVEGAQSRHRGEEQSAKAAPASEGSMRVPSEPAGRPSPAGGPGEEVRRWVAVALPAATGALVLTAAAWAWNVPTVAVVLGTAAIAIASFSARRREERPTIRSERSVRRSARAEPSLASRAAIDALPDPCFLVDRKGLVRFANRTASDQMGPIRIGDPLSFKLRVPVFLEALDRALTEGRSDHIHWSEKVPTERWFEAYVLPLGAQGDDDEETGLSNHICVLVRDLTEQRRLERMREDFVANASHELRTPLASLTGFIETLQGPARDDTAARERFLEIMHDQAERMRRLIDDLLSLSHIEMRAHVRPKDVVDIAEIARHAVDTLKPVAADTGLKLTFEAAEAPLWVRGERDELVQVLDNLIENALKYGAGGERVTVFAEREARSGPDMAVVAVRDWGPGIPSEHLPRLTERFYRVDAEVSRAHKGTGLGLAIVKHILTRHRGRLSIHSQPGRGATFTIRLELAEPPRNADEADFHNLIKSSS
ncbi:two-component system phosphate regulon sensor histidine kinase PhoR [Amorphus orientalis]|uniref:histidine kinase n=1 Tax=Amorphus orientalis TaxID=649198 RepID=A0AAE3VRC6_9HYPH|nr:two-component system phosphate regulon sensor histidine kinase PhoR [Amorphus orientalis]